jgi:hypothetical protein
MEAGLLFQLADVSQAFTLLEMAARPREAGKVQARTWSMEEIDSQTQLSGFGEQAARPAAPVTRSKHRENWEGRGRD